MLLLACLAWAAVERLTIALAAALPVEHRRTIDGVPANFFVYYEIDDDESKHTLSLKDYGHEEVLNAWVLLEGAPEEAAAAAEEGATL